MSIDNVIAKIQKLRRLATSSNVHEAAAAAAAADRLIEQHNLDEALIEVARHKVREEAAAVDDPDPAVVWTGKVPQWQVRLALRLTRHYHCACYTRRHVGGGRPLVEEFYLVGRPDDIAAVRYMFYWLVVEIERLSQLRPGMTVAWRNAFRHGAVIGVVEAMEHSRAEVRRAAPSRALMVMDRRAEEAAEVLREGHSEARVAQVGAASDASGLVTGIRAGAALHRAASAPALPRKGGR